MNIWYHETDPAWLDARRKYLTASDIKKLLPMTPTGKRRPPNQIARARLEVWAEKRSEILYKDTVSRGMAARGHMLEPYAIDCFNKLGIEEEFHHWDDVLLYDMNDHYGLSFSPDASLVRCPEGWVEHDARFLEKNTSILEVKCYGAAAHYIAGRADVLALEERWQIATAMAVSPKVIDAYLVFFNPKCEHKMFVHYLRREDLLDEVHMVDEIDGLYWAAAKEFERESKAKNMAPVTITEVEIIEELRERSAINPV